MSDTDERVFLDDITKLKGAMLAFAAKMLVQHGEFYPFARIIKTDGQLVAYGAARGGEQPDAREAYGRLKAAIAASAKEGDIRAIGLCNDVNLKNAADTSSAIRVLLEYHNGAALEVFVPYRKDPSGKYLFGAEQVQPALPEVFR